MQNDWSEWLSTAEFAYNNRQHSSTGHSSFYLEYGYHPRTPLTIDNPNTNNPTVNDFTNRHALARKSASQALEDTTTTMKRYADCRRKDLPKFKEVQLVWLDLRNIKTGRPTKKLDMRRTGPFPIIK